MPTRLNIIDAVKNDLQNKFNTANGYIDITKDVIVGIPDSNKFPQRPCLGIWPFNDSITQENIGGDRERQLHFVIYGYTDKEDDIHALSEAVERFLYSTDFTYSNDIMLDEEGVTFTTGGVTGIVGLSMFDFRFRIYYTQV